MRDELAAIVETFRKDLSGSPVHIRFEGSEIIEDGSGGSRMDLSSWRWTPPAVTDQRPPRDQGVQTAPS
jgi:hypothetical protein